MEQILSITDKLSLYASNLKCFQSKHKIQCLAQNSCTDVTVIAPLPIHNIRLGFLHLFPNLLVRMLALFATTHSL